ncbi:MAG: M91 family zinc metallopeptidase, partial [Myxococcota bacterium]
RDSAENHRLETAMTGVQGPTSSNSRTRSAATGNRASPEVTKSKSDTTSPKTKAPDSTPVRTATAESADTARRAAASNPAAAQIRARAETSLGEASELGHVSHDASGLAAARSYGTRRSFSVEGASGATLASTSKTVGEAPTLSKTTSSGSTVVTGTAGDDSIQVHPRAGGGVRIVNGSTTMELTDAEARDLPIRAGAGNDTVYVDPNVNYDLAIEGGDGDDTLTAGGGDNIIRGGDGDEYIRGADGDDALFGGEGNDTISGGDGGDYIDGGVGNDHIRGGDGRDVLYGMDGKDVISGGKGRDYIDGGAGDDRLMGGDGIDQVLGGLGDDDLRGGAGDDVLAGGDGTDAYNGDAGADKIFHQDGEWIAADAADAATEVDMSGATLGTSITITGSDEFRARVESDLETLRGLPSGRQMLADLDAAGRTVTIVETTGGNAVDNGAGRVESDWFMTSGNTVNGPGGDSTVHYNPSRIELSSGNPWSARPPLIGLFHELVHSENAATGSLPRGQDAVTGANNLEHIAVGLDIDHDGNPATPRIQPNRNTENGLRDELNLERRDRY